MSEIFLEILKLGGVSAVLLIGFKYTFLFNYRHSYNKKKYGLIKTGLENLQNLYSNHYENSTLPPYILQASVNECLTTNKYDFKLIFFLMNKGVLNLVDTAKEINRAWPFLKIVELEDNKIELRTKYSLEKIRKWNCWCLWIYILVSFSLVLLELLQSLWEKKLGIDFILIIVFSIVVLISVTAFFGSKLTSIICLSKYIKFNARD